MRSIRIFKPYKRGAVTRSGKFLVTTKNRILFVIPFIDKVTKIDMREQRLRIPPQKILTRDNSEIMVESEIHYTVCDPVMAFDHIDNVETTLENLVITHVRKVLGSRNWNLQKSVMNLKEYSMKPQKNGE
ncbi:MAG: SPFH domain-containing protein [Candidatus Methanofastidiosia archaeon]